jgi:hypothetical protein
MGLDLYKPDYEQTVRVRGHHGASVEQLVNDLGELVVANPRSRDTYPVSTPCSSMFRCPALIFWHPANAIRLSGAISIDLRAFRFVFLVFAGLSRFGRVGP